MLATGLLAAQPGLDPARAAALVAECNSVMLACQITTVKRAAMFQAMIGEESGSLRWQQEIAPAPDAPYQPFVGRTFIQITWNYNYQAFGQWCHAKGILADPNQFVNDPPSLADDKWAWWGPGWFWSTHGLNGYADRSDIYGATLVVNGGLNGLADRTARWQACLRLGAAILPTLPPAPVVEDDMYTLYQIAAGPDVGRQYAVAPGQVPFWLGPSDKRAFLRFGWFRNPDAPAPILAAELDWLTAAVKKGI